MSLNKAYIIKGSLHSDTRGILKYNNNFDLTEIKRVYSVSNSLDNKVRGWQGHLVEKRWFIAAEGSFSISVASIIEWPLVDKNQDIHSFTLEDNMNVLYVPEGNVTYIEQVSSKGTLLVFADYFFKEINDEYRLELDFFSKS